MDNNQSSGKFLYHTFDAHTWNTVTTYTIMDLSSYEFTLLFWLYGSLIDIYSDSSNNTFADFHGLYIQDVYTESYGFELNGSSRGGGYIRGSVKYNASTKMIRYNIINTSPKYGSLSENAWCFLYLQ